MVLLTAFSDRDLIEDAREAGVLGYISKPFREADLVPTLEVAIAQFRRVAGNGAGERQPKGNAGNPASG